MRTFDNQSESLWEKADSNKMGSSHPIFEMLQSLSAQIDAEMAHSKQLNDNYRELEHSFQQLQAEYQNLCEEFKQLKDLNNELQLESQSHSQQLHALSDYVQQYEHFHENLIMMQATIKYRGDVNIKKNGEQKFYSIQEYYRFKNVKFVVSSSKLQNLHVLLQKKSKETGFETKNLNIHGREDWAYHCYVLQLILCF